MPTLRDTPDLLAARDAGDYAFFRREFASLWAVGEGEVDRWFDLNAPGLPGEGRADVIDLVGDYGAFMLWDVVLLEGLNDLQDGMSMRGGHRPPGAAGGVR